MQHILINVPGHPRPQPRPRFAKGKVISSIDPRARAWKNSVVSTARASVGDVGGSDALREILGCLKSNAVEIVVQYRIPTYVRERWGNAHLQKPDRDNLDKLVLDGLKTAGALVGDDCVVYMGLSWKVWCKPSQSGASIVLGGIGSLAHRLGIEKLGLL